MEQVGFEVEALEEDDQVSGIGNHEPITTPFGDEKDYDNYDGNDDYHGKDDYDDYKDYDDEEIVCNDCVCDDGNNIHTNRKPKQQQPQREQQLKQPKGKKLIFGMNGL